MDGDQEHGQRNDLASLNAAEMPPARLDWAKRWLARFALSLRLSKAVDDVDCFEHLSNLLIKPHGVLYTLCLYRSAQLGRVCGSRCAWEKTKLCHEHRQAMQRELLQECRRVARNWCMSCTFRGWEWERRLGKGRLEVQILIVCAGILQLEGAAPRGEHGRTHTKQGWPVERSLHVAPTTVAHNTRAASHHTLNAYQNNPLQPSPQSARSVGKEGDINRRGGCLRL